MKSVSMLKVICLQSHLPRNSDTFKELFDEVYREAQKYKEKNWNGVSGKGTYAYLKWQVFRESKKDSDLYVQRKEVVEKMLEGKTKEDNKGYLVSGPNYVVKVNGN